MIFLQITSFTAVMPFMPLLLSSSSNVKIASYFLISLVFIKIIFSLIGGILNDSVTNRKLLLIISLSFNIIIFIFMSILSNDLQYYLWLFLFLYVLTEISNSVTNPIYNAISLDLINNETRKKYSLLKYWLTNLGMAIGMLLGGIFYNSNRSILFLFIAFSLTINLLIVINTKGLSFPSKKVYKNFSFSQYLSIIKHKSFILLLIAIIFIVAAELSMSSYVSVRLNNDFEKVTILSNTIDGVKMYSILMFLNTIIVLTCNFKINKLISNFSSQNIIFIGGLLYTIGYSLLMICSNFWILIFLIFIATIGEIIFSPQYETEKIKLIPPDKKGVYSALDTFTTPLATLISRMILLYSAFYQEIIISLLVFLIVSVGFIFLYIVTSLNQKNILK